MSIKSPSSSPQLLLKNYWNNNNQININNQQQENFSTILRNYERHIQRLERYRKAKSFCSLSDESSSNTVNEQLNYFSSSSSQINLKIQQKLNEENEIIKNSEEINIISNQTIDNTKNIYINSCNKDEQQFEELKEKMMMLVENDILLLAKLLSLGDTLHELRQYQQQKQKYINTQTSSFSTNNLIENELEEFNNNEDFDEYKDECKPLNENKKQKILFFNGKQRKQKRYPIPPEFGEGITRVFVDEEENKKEKIEIKEDEENDDNDEEEEEEEHLNIQYFSRKNSVLRIPIPPRSSNRAFASRTKHNLPSTSEQSNKFTTSPKIINKRQKFLPQPKEIIKDFVESTSATTEIDSGHSSASEHPSPAPPLKEENKNNSSRFSTISSSCISSAPSSLSACSSRNIFDSNDVQKTQNDYIKNENNTEIIIQRTMANENLIKDKNI
ncbi:hypothetical protein ACQ4LE_004856 [Meloidogyne hapla]